MRNLSRLWFILYVTVRHPVRMAIAIFWWCLGKRLRARNRLRILMRAPQSDYGRWLVMREPAMAAAVRRARDSLNARDVTPRLSVAVIAGSKSRALNRSLKSVLDQTYDNCEFLIVGPESTRKTLKDSTAVDDRVAMVTVDTGDLAQCLDQALEAATGDYFMVLEEGDQLAEAALAFVGQAIAENGLPDVLYADEDQIWPSGQRRQPHFKPQWNRELFLAQNYVGGLCVLRSGWARETSPFRGCTIRTALHALILGRLADGPEPTVYHIPHVLYHRRVQGARGPRILAPTPAESTCSRAALQDYLDKAEPGATASVDRYGFNRVHRALPAAPPKVSLIIPTRDRVGLLKRSVGSILAKTTYPNFEILIVDNDSARQRTHDYFEDVSTDPRVRVLACPGPFNFSAINNFAVGEATGAFIGLINNDTEVISPDWLTELMSYAVLSHVGAVGAKLLYSDRRIQHAGVITGLGLLAGHAHRFQKDHAPGYFYRAQLPQYLRAVTAACLIVDKAKFLAVDGLDEDGFRVAFNDVDLCLKLEAAGWRNVYTPHARLYHYESKSRGGDLRPQHRKRYDREAALLQERWGTDTRTDPNYSPNLTFEREDFSLRFNYALREA